MRCLTHFFISLMLFTLCLFSISKAQTVETLAILSGRPEALSIDSRGNIYTPLPQLGQVVRITPNGTVTVILSGLNSPLGGGFDHQDNFYISNYNTGVITKLSYQNYIVPQYALGLSGPVGIIEDTSRTFLYIANYNSSTISKINKSDSMVTPFTSSSLINGPDGFAYDNQGTLYLANFNDTRINKIHPNGTVEFFTVLPGSRIGFLAFARGDLYTTGLNTNKIYKVTLSGDTGTIAGTGVAGLVNGPAATARFNNPNGIVASLTGDTIFIGDAFNNAIRMLILNNVGIQSTGSEIPERFELGQNYPNPFNPETVISFQLPAFNKVRLSVYDISGKEIALLVNEKLQAGSYKYTFDGSGLSSGMYFYKLQSGQFSETKKMLLIK